MTPGPIVSAPGKLFLAGEYAVLDGGTAVVAAISRRAEGRFEQGREPESPLVAEAMRLARDWLPLAGREPPPPGTVEIDTTALFQDGRKLGLGSSAAVAVVAVGATLEAVGRPVGGKRGAIRRMATRAHRTFQGGVGSGADVAASTYGGLLAVKRDEWELAVDRLPPLPGELVVFSTALPSSTVDAVRTVAALREREPERYSRLVGAIDGAADEFRRAVEGSDRALLVGAARAAHAALDALGQAAGVAIVTPELAAAAALAGELGGAAKPSGAGGGDVGVAFFAAPAQADAFRARAPGLGLGILDVSIDPLGVSRRAGGVQERDHVARQS